MSASTIGIRTGGDEPVDREEWRDGAEPVRRSGSHGWGRRLAVCWTLIATVALAAVAETSSFDGFSNGTLLTTQLSASQGISFPQGVVVTATSAARSAPNVAVPQFDGEFMRDRFEAQFSSGQEDVTVHVKRQTGQSQVATLRAYDGSGFAVDSDSVTLSSDDVWYALSVHEGLGRIRRVELVATQGSFETNFVMIDDVVFEASSPPPPPPVDDTPPTLSIFQPATDGLVFGDAFLDVRIRAEDDTDLLSVDGNVVHLPTGEEVALLDSCGSAFSGVCTNPVETTRTVYLSPAVPGEHRIRVTACDGSSNCTTRNRTFEYDPPAPPPSVVVERLEVNQGVQWIPSEISPPGDIRRNYASGVPIVGGRDTVIRFYLFADGAPRNDYSARLRIRIVYDDGTTLLRNLSMNDGQSEVDLVARPGSSAGVLDEIEIMRASLDRTLDFVVPGDLLLDASHFDLRLESGSPITSEVRVAIRPEVRLAVKDVQLFGPGIPDNGGAYPTAAQFANIFRYLEEAYPVSEVVVLDSGRRYIGRDLMCELFTTLFTDAQLACALWQFQWWTPGPSLPRTEDPIYETIVGSVPYGSFSRVGMAMNRHSLAFGWSDVSYAHEIGHNAGRPHAGGAHGEGGGEPWPYPHGLMSTSSFGVVTSQTAAPGSSDFGTWEIKVVDPCPGPAAADGPNCSLPAEGVGTHDFMSYGDSSIDLGPLNDRARDQNWISDLNYTRIYNQILSEGETASAGSTTLFTGIEAPLVLVDGIIGPDGSVELLPLVQVQQGGQSLQGFAAGAEGSWSLRLLDGDGGVLHQRSFTPTEMFDAGPESVFMIGQRVPHFTDLRSIEVLRDGEVVATQSASASAPTVQVLSPNGGEVFESGEITIEWERDDADGGGVLSQIQYSADDGLTWIDLGMVGRDDPPRLTLTVADLPASDRARFRVVVSDGFRLASDVSDCTFGVGVAEAAECTPPVASNCTPSSTALCLSGGRYQVEMEWRTAAGASGQGRAVPLEGGDSGFFWFFQQENVEALVKVLDGCSINGHKWVFSAGLTDVETRLVVTDTETGESVDYETGLGVPYPPVRDVEAFAACGEAGLASGPAEGLTSIGSGAKALPLVGGRFEVTMDWRIPDGSTGTGTAVPLTEDTGTFWFFNASNVEAVVKVLDACSVNQRYWLFASGLTDVEVTMTVRDTVADVTREFTNSLGRAFQPIQDIGAFDTCSQ